jgi:hypothetical protein
MMSVQGYTPTKDTKFEVALEEPPAAPVTWVGVPVDVDIYDISGMPLVRSVVDTTTLGASRFREQTKLLYDAIEVNFTFFHTGGGLGAWNILLNDEDPSDRWWKLIFGDGSNFIFAAGVTKLDTVSGPVDDVVRVEATLTASGDVTYATS